MASPLARHLRKNPTDAESRLWQHLQQRQLAGFRFRRQAPLGPYVADFVCQSEKLVVEVDGGEHADRIEHDNRRTAWLAANGYRVLRFWNNDVLGNTESVLETILKTIEERA
jgi:adenine-specific DNA-methyltransferase